MRNILYNFYLADIELKVALKESNKQSNKLTLTVIDSLSATGESVVEVPLYGNNVQLAGRWDQLCLGHRKCFFLDL